MATVPRTVVHIPLHLRLRALSDRSWIGLRGRSGAWVVYAVLGGLALAAYLVVPIFQDGPFFNLISISAVVAIVVGVRLHRPRDPLP